MSNAVKKIVVGESKISGFWNVPMAATPQMPVSPDRAILSAQEAADFLSIKLTTLYGWVHKRLVPYRKHGNKLVFAKSSLEAWSQAREVAPVYSAASIFGRDGSAKRTKQGR